MSIGSVRYRSRFCNRFYRPLYGLTHQEMNMIPAINRWAAINPPINLSSFWRSETLCDPPFVSNSSVKSPSTIWPLTNLNVPSGVVCAPEKFPDAWQLQSRLGFTCRILRRPFELTRQRVLLFLASPKLSWLELRVQQMRPAVWRQSQPGFFDRVQFLPASTRA